jgi:hypothetical protein
MLPNGLEKKSVYDPNDGRYSSGCCYYLCYCSSRRRSGSISNCTTTRRGHTSLGEVEEEENLADNIVSNVLDGGSDDGEEENGETSAADDVEIVDQENFAEDNANNMGLQGQEQEQGQRAANLDQNVQEDEEEPSTTPTPRPPDNGLPPEVEPPIENGKIAFTSTRDDNREIYVMNADGSEQTRLTTDPGYEDRPDWGPAVDTEP